MQVRSVTNRSSHPQGPDENGHGPYSCSFCGPHRGRGGRHEWLEASTGLHEETALGEDRGLQGPSAELEDEGQGKYLARPPVALLKFLRFLPLAQSVLQKIHLLFVLSNLHRSSNVSGGSGTKLELSQSDTGVGHFMIADVDLWLTWAISHPDLCLCGNTADGWTVNDCLRAWIVLL